MENSQKVESDIPQWITIWAKNLLKNSFVDANLVENSTKLIETILTATTRGDSCISSTQDQQILLKNLLIDEQTALSQVAPFVSDSEKLYLYRYWHLEDRLAKQIQRLKNQPVVEVDVSTYQDLLEDPYQWAAMEMVAKNAFNIITGGPGTGKTYTLARIIGVLHQTFADIRIAMAAPTGKAAQRMKEALQGSLGDPKLINMGIDVAHLQQQGTQTIHRLLGLGSRFRPRYHAKNPLPYDVIVIDEASMLDLQLATMLLEAVPDHCRLILLGDANQLASVDVGAVLADLQQVQTLQSHRVNLVTSRRFSDEARIGKLARFIQNQTDDIESQHLLHLFETQIALAQEIQAIELVDGMRDQVQLAYLPLHIEADLIDDYYKTLALGFNTYFNAISDYLKHQQDVETMQRMIYHFDDYRILTAVRHGAFGLIQLNEAMQRRLLKEIPQLIVQGDWYVGRPVMMVYNDYQLGLSNGDIGICLKHRTQADQFEVYFPSLDAWFPASRLPKSIQTAFVLTIHKSQGSEFKHTAVILDASSEKLLSQELLYTAITRAKTVVSLLVEPQAFVKALSVKTTRSSGLVKKINKLI